MASNVNIDATVAKLDEVTTRNVYQHHCSYYVARAVNAGLPAGARPLVTNPGSKAGPANGGAMGPILVKAGYREMISKVYTPQAGDVAVVPAPADDKRRPPPGHVAMYDGQEWVSDTRQGPSPNPYSNKRPLSGNIRYYRP